MSQIKLVTMDLDGTLLNDKKQISEHTREVLSEAARRGVHIVPATGRIFKAIPDFIRDIEGIRYAICCNGATIYDAWEDKIIYKNHIPKETVLTLIRALAQCNCTRDIYRNGQGYMEEKFYNHLEDFDIKGQQKDLILRTRQKIDDLEAYVEESSDGIEKVSAFFGDLEERKRVMKELDGLGIASVSSALFNNIEITQIGCDKGDGITQLAKYLSIPMEETMACGDAANDTYMIKAAGFGVVMENGMDELKEMADFVTKSNEEDGVAYAIERFVLN